MNRIKRRPFRPALIFTALATALLSALLISGCNAGGTSSPSGKSAPIKALLNATKEKAERLAQLRGLWQEREEEKDEFTQSVTITQIDMRQAGSVKISTHLTVISQAKKSPVVFKAELQFSGAHDLERMSLKFVDERGEIIRDGMSKPVADEFVEYKELVDWLKNNELVVDVISFDGSTLVLHENFPEKFGENVNTTYKRVPDEKALPVLE